MRRRPTSSCRRPVAAAIAALKGMLRATRLGQDGNPKVFGKLGWCFGPTGHSAPNGTVVAAARVGHAGSSVAALTWTAQPRPGLAARDAREGPKAQVINIYARQLFAAAENTIHLPGRQGQRRVPLPTVRGMDTRTAISGSTAAHSHADLQPSWPLLDTLHVEGRG
ncbi:hypothetical protein BT67DRAFT_264099 [Trichocladium antarcticum]|uniref:Uncharacterized protein n=1 Tax=Trichocladium antarcticum TaxID=1450529 RepID=A0AAN6UNB1_9PEZI|nr:hypothetical protein BT67DRAFT_264099 [Trichocladium antarcticum]